MTVHEYGPEEFLNITELLTQSLQESITAREPVERLVGSQFDQAHDRANRLPDGNGLIFYLPPGWYGLPLRAGESSSRYELPANVQLFVCAGALIRPAEGVDLVVRGSIRAGKHQIFGYDRDQVLPATVSNSPAVRLGRTIVNTVPLGRIILATRKVPLVMPEWWGARPTPAGFLESADATQDRAYDCSDSLQAAIDAACVRRAWPEPGSAEPVRWPTIPVLLGSGYQCNHTIEVRRPDGSSSVRLMLRGSAGLGGPNSGLSSITRFSDPPPPAGAAPRGESCALRLGPGVDFEIEDVYFGIGAGVRPDPLGCLDVVCDVTEVVPRRGLLRRVTLIGGSDYALRIRERGGLVRRHFVVDSCTVSPATITHQSRSGIEVDAGPSVMLHIDGGLMGSPPLPFVEGAPLPKTSNIHLTGASVLVEATQFHYATGPRPSRGDASSLESLQLREPDGQDVFLAPRGLAGSSSHFTAIQCECQSWWFLSRASGGEDQVSLVGVAHGSPNWGDPRNVSRYLERNPPNRSTVGRGTAPTVVWLGHGGQCVMVGCRFERSVLTEPAALSGLIDVATVFRVNVDPNRVWMNFLPASNPGSIVRPPAYDLAPLTEDEALDHLVHQVVLIDGV